MGNSPWCHKESDMTEQPNIAQNNDHTWKCGLVLFLCLLHFCLLQEWGKILRGKRDKVPVGTLHDFVAFSSLEGICVHFSAFPVWSTFICKSIFICTVTLFLIRNRKRINCPLEIHALKGTGLSDERKLC